MSFRIRLNETRRCWGGGGIAAFGTFVAVSLHLEGVAEVEADPFCFLGLAVLVEEVEEELALMMTSSRHPFPAEEEAEAEEAPLFSGFTGAPPGGGGRGAVEEEQKVEVQVQMGALGGFFRAIFSAAAGAEEGEQMKTSAAEAKEPEAVSR